MIEFPPEYLKEQQRRQYKSMDANNERLRRSNAGKPPEEQEPIIEWGGPRYPEDEAPQKQDRP